MPRQARAKGEFSTYHVIQRGNERKEIFISNDDRTRFLDTLKRMKMKYNFIIEAYCLMDNHVHLLINDNGNDISQIVKSINISYAYYFNRIYNRCGHLFQDRFRSELVDNDKYLLQVSKYIHNNPVKAGIANTPGEYKWSSYNDYFAKAGETSELIDCSRVLGIVSDDRRSAVTRYIEYMREEEPELNIMDVEGDLTGEIYMGKESINSIEQARDRLKEKASSMKLDFRYILANKELRNEMIKEMRKVSSLTLKQLGELFEGISESRLSRILKG